MTRTMEIINYGDVDVHAQMQVVMIKLIHRHILRKNSKITVKKYAGFSEENSQLGADRVLL